MKLAERFMEELKDGDKRTNANLGVINRRKTKYRFKFLNISNATKAHCLQDFEGSLRTDVLYKTIIRDLRKYFSNDFNDITLFIKRKRYKNENYFF